MKFSGTILSVAMLLVVCTATADARRVLCIDQKSPEDDYLTSKEGWERQNAHPPTDIVTLGGNLTTCLAQVMKGDTLVIVAHSKAGGAGFIWGGVTYTGFGNGPGQLPVPAGFGTLKNVFVEFCACWSLKDPDAAGPDSSLVKKIIGAMGGAGNGNTGAGFIGEAQSRACYKYTYPASVKTLAQAATFDAAVKACLDATAWAANPPTNRQPPATTTQQTAAQAAVDACPTVGPPGTITITIVYKSALDLGDKPSPWGAFAALGGDECGTVDSMGEGFFGPQFVPALTGGARMILAALLLLAGWVALRRRRPRFGPPQ